jgi:hypothetical protein
MLRTLSLLMIGLALNTSAFGAGALAIDENQGDQYGFAYGYDQPNDAINRALNECGGNCQIVQTFSGGCAAYAADQASGSSVYGWATGSSGGEVQSAALQYCRNYGGSACVVRAWACE